MTPKKATRKSCELLEEKCERLEERLKEVTGTGVDYYIQLIRERQRTGRLISDLQIVMAAGADTLCGSKWINAKGLQQALARYGEDV